MKKYNGFYLMGNYPDKDTFIKTAVKGLEHFDFLEVGIPFSDPNADGDVISDAAQTLLDRNCTFSDISESIKTIRKSIPVEKDIYIMTYANIIYNMEIPAFNTFCKENGVKGLILPDVPFCEKEFFAPLGLDPQIKLINFMTPESTTESIDVAAEASENFIYFVSMRGITGTDFNLDKETMEKIDYAKSRSKVPVVTGFGIKSKDSAAKAMEHSDGFIIGTALIEALNTGGYEKYAEFVDGLF
ncbi:MAG: tryptophan synthase subunit alpha [Spirochaetae bacterium HGW-Spirochaetae-5]|nr:MAG: tryptophan synthase subunit alpha [Spirochaetae bacterium HGW-Spirochaetae-5]